MLRDNEPQNLPSHINYRTAGNQEIPAPYTKADIGG